MALMKFLLLNQTFHPDVPATAQYLTDVARALAERGHKVSVIAGRYGYDQPQTVFSKREVWNGIEIHRVRGTRFGKTAKWRRAFDFASFMLSCCCQLLRTPRADVVVALTSPPLISFIAACYAAVRGIRFVYWVMDLNPDEAIAAGWLRESSFAARILNWLSEFSLRRADAVIVLDRFMQKRVLEKNIAPEKVFVIPPWSHDGLVCFDETARDEFRYKQRLSGKYVVMYSGNHSPCHPLDSVLNATLRFKDDPGLAFCFIGGGSEFSKVQEFAKENGSSNIFCLPYQPTDGLAGSLSAADLHVVVMGEKFVGTIHPCKIYNVMRVAPAILYIGPKESHITDIFQDSGTSGFLSARNHDSASIADAIQHARALTVTPTAFSELAEPYSQRELLPRLVSVLESCGIASPCSVAESVRVA
jgi:colanic acid biosynthesis glycosyl transferase WcaI